MAARMAILVIKIAFPVVTSKHCWDDICSSCNYNFITGHINDFKKPEKKCYSQL